MEQQAKLQLTMASRLDCVSFLGQGIDSLCSLFRLSEAQSYGLQLCVVEAATNVVKHAYRNDPNHRIEVSFTMSSARVVIEISDYGKALDSSLLENREFRHLEIDLMDIQSLPESGWGLAILKSFMDQVSYISEGGRNCLTLTKNLVSGTDEPGKSPTREFFE